MKLKIKNELKNEIKSGKHYTENQLVDAVYEKIKSDKRKIRGILQMNFGKSNDLKVLLNIMIWLNKI